MYTWPMENINSLRDLFIGFLAGSGLMAFLFQESFKEWLGRSNIKWKEKRTLAKYVLKKLAEGQHDAYKSEITSKQQLNAFNIADEIEAYDYKLAADFRVFIALWASLYLLKSDKETKSYKDLVAEADKIAEFVREKIKTWIR